LQFVENGIPDHLGIAPQLGIPIPHSLDATGFQKFLTLKIMLSLIGKSVLAAVQFHIQFGFLTKEVQKVNSQRMLAAEFITVEPPVTQPTPHELFGPGFFLPENAGTSGVGHVKMLCGFVFCVKRRVL
jgi:hypothetical protein